MQIPLCKTFHSLDVNCDNTTDKLPEDLGQKCLEK